MVGEISDDGQWVWNGTEWIPNADGNRIEELEGRVNELESVKTLNWAKLRVALLLISVILAIVAVKGNSWMTVDGGDLVVEFGLEGYIYEGDCGVNCDKIFYYADECYIVEGDSALGSSNDVKCDRVTLGNFVSILLWLGIVSGGMRIIVPRLGIQNNLPVPVRIAVSLSTSFLLLCGTLWWYFQTPEYIDGFGWREISIHYWLSLTAGLLALFPEILNPFLQTKGE